MNLILRFAEGLRHEAAHHYFASVGRKIGGAFRKNLGIRSTFSTGIAAWVSPRSPSDVATRSPSAKTRLAWCQLVSSNRPMILALRCTETSTFGSP